MNCKTYKESLHSYINQELNASEAAAVAEHLKSCPGCQREAEEIIKLKAIAKAFKPDIIQLNNIKGNIMSAIMAPKKVLSMSYDIKVLGRLGASLVACGLLAFALNFSSIDSIKYDINQPIAYMNKGLQNMSSKIIDLNGITFRLEQRYKGGMKGEM
jgi:predicted Fe-S protein YdhL (DUF1289 family)